MAGRTWPLDAKHWLLMMDSCIYDDGNHVEGRIGDATLKWMSELIDRILKSSKHEEQAFNACAGILHRVKAIPKGIAEEAARKCIEMNSCRYSTYRQVLKKMECDEHPESSPESLPSHENIRGKDYYK